MSVPWDHLGPECTRKGLLLAPSTRVVGDIVGATGKRYTLALSLLRFFPSAVNTLRVCMTGLSATTACTFGNVPHPRRSSIITVLLTARPHTSVDLLLAHTALRVPGWRLAGGLPYEFRASSRPDLGPDIPLVRQTGMPRCLRDLRACLYSPYTCR